MHVKKFFAILLTTTIFISTIQFSAFASGFIQISSNSPYVGKHLNLNSWVSYTIPSFNGVPLRTPGDAAFYSSKGEIKLNITEVNRSYFENGGHVDVYVRKDSNKLHLNPFDWANFLAYKPKSGSNSFKIKGPQREILKPLNDLIYLFSLNSTFKFVLTLLAGGFVSWHYFIPIGDILENILIYFSASLAIPYIQKILNWACSPIKNLVNNIDDTGINFDFGIVLTTPDDEFALATTMPKVGDVNEKKLNEIRERDTKNKALLNKVTGSIAEDKKDFFYRKQQKELIDSCKYTEEEIDSLKKEKSEKLHKANSKLSASIPINDGFVCRLDKDHPSQTFRLVVNNQLSENNADLFAIALQNNAIELNQNDNRVRFDVVYNALDEKSGINNRLSRTSAETQQKINIMNNIGKQDLITTLFSWLNGLWKNNFVVSNTSNGYNQSAAEDMIRKRNAEYLKKAEKVYKNNPNVQTNNHMSRANTAYQTNKHLEDNIAQSIDTNYNALPWYQKVF
ncbi:MAG: hypothetical protein IJ758_03565 [Clostridia bacterium]|nr:hypothetical protein [Clostridia bacterium]